MMKLNCDIGEGMGDVDRAVMPYIDMANIACGFHASNPQLMAETVDLAIAHHVMIGAHPSYPDREGFGRRDMECSASDIQAFIQYQVGALQAICYAQGATLSYVKPHGALYNRMMRDESVFAAVIAGVASIEQNLALMVLANHRADDYCQMARQYHVPIVLEAFCDRAYSASGELISRSEPQSVLTEKVEIQQRLDDLIVHQQVTTIDGDTIPVSADTICVHGDNEKALAIAKMAKATIAKANGC